MAKRRSNGGGSVTKKKDKNGNILYYARVSLADGNRVGKYFKKEKEAQAWLTENLNNVQKGIFVAPDKMTFGEWITNWLENYMKNSTRQTTYCSYESTIKLHILPKLGNIPLQKLQTSDLQKLYNEKFSSGRADKKGGGLSARTVHYMHMIIHNSLSQAIKEKLVMLNVSEYCILPKNEKKEMKYLDEAGIKALLTTAKENRYYKHYYAAYLLLLSTGLRRGELLGLRWKDVEIEEEKVKDKVIVKGGVIHVRQQLVRLNGKPVIQDLKTIKSKRDIIIDGAIAAEMKIYRQKRMEELLQLGIQYKAQGDDLVFTSETGGYIYPENFKRNLKGCLKAAGLDTTLRVHSLRHSFAVLSLANGVDVKTLQDDLGHHSAAFTLDQYGHASTQMKKEAAQKRGNILKSIIEK